MGISKDRRKSDDAYALQNHHFGPTAIVCILLGTLKASQYMRDNASRPNLG